MPKPVAQPQPNHNSENRLFEYSLRGGYVLTLSLSIENECKSSLKKDGVPVQNYVYRSPEKDTVAKLCGRVTPSQIKCKTHCDLVEIRVEDPQEGLRGGGNINFKPAAIQKPKGAEPSECKENYSSGFFHLAPEHRRISVSQSTPQPLPTITAMRSTRELALTIKALATKEKKTPTEIGTHNDFVKFVRESIKKAFKDIEPKTPRILQELTELVLSDNKDICQDVLEAVFAEITGATFQHGNIMSLQALQDVLRKTNPAHFNPLQLVQVLTTIAGACAKIHSQYATLKELDTHVEVIADILVTMADAQVRGVSYKEVHKPLFEFLETVAKDSNQITFTNKKAQLALEALKCIKHNKTDLDINFHRFIAFAKGVNYIMAAPLDGGIIESIEGVIDSFKVAFYKQSKGQGWYQHFRFLDVLIKTRRWKTFQDEFFNTIKALSDSEYPDLLTNIVYSLNTIVSSDLEKTDDRVEALNLLRAFYKNDGKYSLSAMLHSQLASGTDGDVRTQIHEELLREFLDYARFANVTISTIAKDFLGKVQLAHLKGITEEAWLRNVGLATIDLDALEPLPAKGIVIKRTHELLKAARKLNLASVDAKVRELKTEHGNPDADVNRLRIATFGELEGRDLSAQKVVNVKETLLEWLKSDQKVALVDSTKGGAGKTTLVKMMHHLAWKMHSELPRKTAIVEILSDAIKSSAKNAVTNVLREPFGEENLAEMQNEYTVIALCDELDALELQANFFLANKEWKNLRMLFTGRRAHLPKPDEDLIEQFGHPEDKRFLHIRLLDFDASRSMETLKKYVTHDPQAPYKQETTPGTFPYKAWDFSKYEEYLKSHPEVAKMIQHPSALVSVFKGLPGLVEKRAQDKTAPDQVLTIDILKFEIDEQVTYERTRIKKIVSNSSDPEIARKYKIPEEGFAPEFYSYCKDFVALAAQMNRTSILYLASDNEDDCPSPIVKFLGNPKKQMYRETCLIKNDRGEYQFHEERFFDYWLHLVIVEGLRFTLKKDKEELSTPTSMSDKETSTPTSTTSLSKTYSFSQSRSSESSLPGPYALESFSSGNYKQRQWAHLFSIKHLENSVIALIAQAVSREPDLKELLNKYAGEKRPSSQKTNSEKVIYALSFEEMHDADDFKVELVEV